MNTFPFPVDSLLRLASRVLKGDVVFFIGSGFSIDSEGNTATRLMVRLLIRLLAFTDVLGEIPDVKANRMLKDLGRTFQINISSTLDKDFRFDKKDVTKLAGHYYEANAWFCFAYGHLLKLIGQRPETSWKDLLKAIEDREEEIRVNGRGDGKPLDAVPLDEIDLELVCWACSIPDRDSWLPGKALFLDAMGFRHKDVMGGEPTMDDLSKVIESYGIRLLPRHHIVARLAREGFCSTILTTNFDLLLEGAFRIAGFRVKSPDSRHTVLPPTYYDDLARIASPTEFFAQGKAHRSAVLVKIHGCAEKYRDITHDRHDDLAAYMRSMVFTYREIQNWREDSWAADYLRTLLRTRTVVFCGYSLRDPVIHDTFRTVYEDMARQLQRAGGSIRNDKVDKSKEAENDSTAKAPESGDAPAFFFAPASEDSREFHGMEVLRAATEAVGADYRPFDSHPNYLRFHHRRGERGFPRLDESFQWLYHAVFRLRQQECLESYLHRTVTGLLGKPRPEAELQAVRNAFSDLWKWEQDLARAWGEPCRSRREHAAVCSWTSHFHTSLMREFGSIEMVHSCRASRKLSVMRQLPWYYPTTAADGWACWGTVVELALRNMIAAMWGGLPDDSQRPFAIRASESFKPTVLFSTSVCLRMSSPSSIYKFVNQKLSMDKLGSSATLATPAALTISFRACERLGASARIIGCPVRKVCWELTQNDVPWPSNSSLSDGPDVFAPPTHSDHGRAVSWRDHCVRAPSAAVIWAWATGQNDTDMLNELSHWLGLAGDKP